MNITKFRNEQYDGYNTDELILAAIEQVAGVELPTDIDESKNLAHEIWAAPTDEQDEAVMATIPAPGEDDETTLYWGTS